MTAQTKTQALIAAAAVLTAQQDAFKVGDVVVLKQDGFDNKRQPEVGQPVVVTKVYETAIFCDKDTGTPYFNEPLDFVFLTTAASDGSYIEFHGDSRRFRIATQEDIDAWEKQQAEAE